MNKTVLVSALALLAVPAFAGSSRTVVAAGKLPSAVEAPLYFRALHVSIPPHETSADILYQISRIDRSFGRW